MVRMVRISGVYDLAEVVGNDTEQGLAQLENLYALHMDNCLMPVDASAPFLRK